MVYDSKFFLQRAQYVRMAEKMKRNAERIENGLEPDYRCRENGEKSYVKIIKSGDKYDVYKYEIPITVGFTREGVGRTVEKSDRAEENRKLSVRRAMEHIRRLLNANFTNRDKFMTLTFRRTDLENERLKQIVEPEGNRIDCAACICEGREMEGGLGSEGSARGSDGMSMDGDSVEYRQGRPPLLDVPHDTETDSPEIRNKGESQSRAAPERRRKTNEEQRQGVEASAECSLCKIRNQRNDVKSNFDVTDVGQTNIEFKKFIQRLRRYVQKKGGKEDFGYLAAIEFQDDFGRGAVHYHVVSQQPYIPHSDLVKLWGHGTVNIKAIDAVDNVGSYISSYMLKDLADPRLMGKKAYLVSRGLNKPEEFVGEVAHAMLRTLENEEKEKRVYEYVYPSEWFGQIHYSEYNMKADKKYRAGRRDNGK
jgi:hypothetical protein